MRARVERGQTIVRAVLLVAAIGLVGVLLYRQADRFGGGRVPMWVAASELKPGETVRVDTMKLVQHAPAAGVLVDGPSIGGRKLKQAKREGEPFVVSALEPRPAPPPLAATVPNGRLLAT